MSITISLIHYDKSKNGNFIESGKSEVIKYYNFSHEYPINLFEEIKDRFELKHIKVYEGTGEEVDLFNDAPFLPNEKVQDILDYINSLLKDCLGKNPNIDREDDYFYNLDIIREILELKNNEYKDNNSVVVLIDYYFC